MESAAWRRTAWFLLRLFVYETELMLREQMVHPVRARGIASDSKKLAEHSTKLEMGENLGGESRYRSRQRPSEHTLAAGVR